MGQKSTLLMLVLVCGGIGGLVHGTGTGVSALQQCSKLCQCKFTFSKMSAIYFQILSDKYKTSQGKFKNTWLTVHLIRNVLFFSFFWQNTLFSLQNFVHVCGVIQGLFNVAGTCICKLQQFHCQFRFTIKHPKLK